MTSKISPDGLRDAINSECGAEIARVFFAVGPPPRAPPLSCLVPLPPLLRVRA